MFDVFDNFAANISASNFFDAETWRSVDFEDERTASGTHEIDAGDMETHGASSADGEFFLFVGEFDGLAETALVEVGAEIVIERLALHGSDDLGANDEGTDVGTSRFFNIFLDEDDGAVFVVEVESLESRFGGFFRVGENDAVAMSTGRQFDDNRKTDLFEQIIDIGRVARNKSFWRIDAGFGEDLLGTQFVAGAGDGDGAGSCPDALHFELTDDGATIFGHVVGNARQNSIKTGKFGAFIEDIRVFFVERNITIFIFDDLDFVSASLSLFDETFGGIVGVAVG